MIPEFAHSLYQCFEREGIPLLLAGGWAVCHHGYARTTLDIDWICPRSCQGRVDAPMERLGFGRIADDIVASRFRHESRSEFPFVDLIWVEDEVFERMARDSSSSARHSSVPVVSFRGLIAMKVFAMKDQETRQWRDFLDIRSLLSHGHETLVEDDLKRLCDRFGDPEIYRKIRFGL